MADVVHGIEGLGPDHGPLLLVVGVFDGLHRGHLYLLRELRRAARRLGARPAVLTFDHHPDEILAGAAPPLLCDPDERVARLERAGVAVTVVQHFDDTLRRTSYTDFVAAIRARTTLAGFLMTPDAAFGHERRGTPQALAALGDEAGFRVVVVPPFDLDGRPVRSTEVRAAIAAGDLRHARALLGRRVAVTGTLAAGSAASAAAGAPRPTEGGGLPDSGRSALLAFALPVALPPDGRYAATIERPILPETPRDTRRTWAPARAAATVADGTLTIEVRRGRLPGAGSGLRVTFVALQPAP